MYGLDIGSISLEKLKVEAAWRKDHGEGQVDLSIGETMCRQYQSTSLSAHSVMAEWLTSFQGTAWSLSGTEPSTFPSTAFLPLFLRTTSPGHIPLGSETP